MTNTPTTGRSPNIVALRRLLAQQLRTQREILHDRYPASDLNDPEPEQDRIDRIMSDPTAWRSNRGMRL